MGICQRPNGGTFTNDIVAVSKGKGKVDVFGVGSDKHAYVRSWNGTNWSKEWYWIGGTFVSALDAVSWADGRVDVLVSERRS